MLKLLNSKLFKFAKFAAKSQGMGTVAPVVMHRNGNVDLYGRLNRR